MKTCIRTAAAVFLIALGAFWPIEVWAEFPSLHHWQMDTWGFDDTDWLSLLGYSPISFTNIENVPGWDGGALQVDSTNESRLNYNIVESDDWTNLTFVAGSIETWFMPAWSSGQGPGVWGRLLDVGAYSTNTPSSWWSLYLTPDGQSICFSSETNGVFTNYLNCPILWDTNTWHYIALTYDQSQSQLYLDGQLAATGTGTLYLPDADATAGGFFVGSDSSGTQQAHGQFDDLATYNYVLHDSVVTNHYAQGLQLLNGGGPGISEGGAGATNGVPGQETLTESVTSLAVTIAGVSNGLAELQVLNSAADILYEIQGRTDLAQGDWVSQGFVYGSELNTWTPAVALATNQGTMFYRIRSWQDSTGTGIPDWWWLSFFNQTTNVDANVSATGDELSNMQKYEMGFDPTVYHNPNAPGGFYGYVAGSNVFLAWQRSPGPVTYSIQRGVLNTNSGLYAYSQVALLSSNVTGFEDAGVLSDSAAWNNVYQLEASYPGASIMSTDVWQVSWYVNNADSGPPNGPPLPNNVYAWLDSTGTNALLTWAAPQGPATNYVVQQGILDPDTFVYTYTTVAHVGTNVTSYEIIGGGTNGSLMGIVYGVAAVYPAGGLSGLSTSYLNLGSSNGPAGPSHFYGYADGTGTNLCLAWDPVSGASGYLLVGGVWDYAFWDDYVVLGSLGAGTHSLVVPGAIDDSGNDLYEYCAVMAIYPGGSLSQAAYWYASQGAPAPQAFSAYLDWTGTNVVLSWSAAQGTVTGYVIQRSGFYGGWYEPLAQVNSAATSYLDVDGVSAGQYFGLGAVEYRMQAMYANGGLSPAVTATIVTNAPAPTQLTATISTTNVLLSWTAARGVVSDYIIERGTFNAGTGAYSYSQIGTVGSGVTSFQDTGVLSSPGARAGVYRVSAGYGNGQVSAPDSSGVTVSGTTPTRNLSLAATLVRNEAGRWQLMFSSISTNVQAVAFYWYPYDYEYDIGPFPSVPPYTTETDIPVAYITNGIYVLPDYFLTNWFGNNIFGKVAMVQPIATDGGYGQLGQVGFQPSDSPVFVDGQRHLKQNLVHEVRAATASQPNARLSESGVWWNPFFVGLDIPTDTNYVESSFFHWSKMYKGYGADTEYIKMDDIWPITVNYQFHATLYDPEFAGAAFTWQPNAAQLTFQGTLATVPADPALGISGPYWIAQDVLGLGIDPITGLPATMVSPGLSELGAYTNGGNLYLQNGVHNIFGPYFQTALVNADPQVTLPRGGSVALSNCAVFFSQTSEPNLEFVDYYFAPVTTPGTAQPGEPPSTQAYPLPSTLGFAGSNQTRLIVASVGAPRVVGGWARFNVDNGFTGIYAYLGQYFVTNALVVANGVLTTNTTGVVSPYGDFFPTEPGLVALRTMPDIDTGAQGTAAVCVVSLNVDANHDGTLDFTWNGPDFVSPSKPFKFWVNDNTDWGDYTGDGVPGQGAKGDGLMKVQVPFSGPSFSWGQAHLSVWAVHGRRDLVDFFPVCLNIGGLFQSNAWCQGINPADTSYQFVLSQADGALRFAYSDLTATNYMDFLLDTNVSESLANALLTTIPAEGVALTNISGIAAANQNVILVEAWQSTTKPLVLTIFHGSNQLAQAQLPLSITGVEQMFRHKNLLLASDSRAPAERLTDADVPNEPDTNEKNFVFLHGYNVHPNQARGAFADTFKRLYWSGSHAKFYGVTWFGSDTQGDLIPGVTCNYHTNVYHAFQTAPYLANFLATLTNGPTVVAAHSLGNMVVLDALSEYNAPISQYFMIDAAVAIEAVQGSAMPLSTMYYSDWLPYADQVNSHEWHNLFSSGDGRYGLTWTNRLSSFHSADVYNFYSSGEEVLRNYTSDPPSDLMSAAPSQLIFTIKGAQGSYAWVWQEKAKGRAGYDTVIGSRHGGWRFNEYYSDAFGNHMDPSLANVLPNAQIQTNAFFAFDSWPDDHYQNVDFALYGAGGSQYAQTNRNRILSDAIPAITLPVGANPVPRLSPPLSAAERNFNLNTADFKNGWPQGRTADNGNWHHSDFREVAYTFTHKLLDDFVTFGDIQ